MEIKFTFGTEKNSLMKIPFLRNLRKDLIFTMKMDCITGHILYNSKFSYREKLTF